MWGRHHFLNISDTDQVLDILLSFTIHNSQGLYNSTIKYHLPFKEKYKKPQILKTRTKDI